MLSINRELGFKPYKSWTTWQVALDRVRATPAAQELLSLCAFLAPDDVPRPLLREHAEALPEPLRGTSGGHWPTTWSSVRWGATPWSPTS